MGGIAGSGKPAETSPMSIPDAIRTALRGRTQESVAEAMGVTQPTISKWVRAETTPSFDQLASLEDACGRPRGFVLQLAGYVRCPTDARTALAADPGLDDDGRGILVDLYDIWVERAEQARQRPGNRS